MVWLDSMSATRAWKRNTGGGCEESGRHCARKPTKHTQRIRAHWRTRGKHVQSTDTHSYTNRDSHAHTVARTQQPTLSTGASLLARMVTMLS